MKGKQLGFFFLCFLILTGCGHLESMDEAATMPSPIVVDRSKKAGNPKTESQEETEPETEEFVIETSPAREPVKVKGIYVSAYVAGTPDRMEDLIRQIETTEINAVVIDLKEDEGRITCAMDSPLVTALGSSQPYISDMKGLVEKLKEHNIYTIARIAAFRDPYLGQVRPEWCLQNGDGTVFRDNKGMSWINPYKREAWDYLVEIGTEASKLGFDEVQFDYIRFCTERGMANVVFDENDVQGYSKTDIITEFIKYVYEKLKNEGLFVSADVFGAIIGSGVDSESVGQIYGQMAKHLDYISPMIYPSHYTDGNFGIDHPDMHPYETIKAALTASNRELQAVANPQEHQAIVRPWLQSFTASYLPHYIEYGPQQVRDQIQATYDTGYDEWLLWSASCRYHWDGLLTPEEAAQERVSIDAARAGGPEAGAETSPDADTILLEEPSIS